MKYDIEFIIPITGQGKYLQRLDCFKSLGLVNIDNCKVSLKLLVGRESIPGIQNDWPENIDVVVINGKRDQIGAKIAEYYANLKPEDIDCRWSAKFDDDSVNDIAGMVKNLDENYDSKLPYYIVTELRKEVHPADRSCAESSGFGHWFRTPGKEPIHEKEGSVISGVGLKKITETPKAMEILRKRSQIEDGWGDIALAYAARAAKMYATECDFLSKDSLVDAFSQLGGHVNHIHYIAPDINELAINFLVGSLRPPKWILGKQYLFGKVGNKGNIESICVFTFHPSGKLTPKMPNEKLWYWNGEELLILDHSARPTSIFKPTNEDKTMMVGEFLQTSSKHILHRIDVSPTDLK